MKALANELGTTTVTSGPKTDVIERFENRVPQSSAAASTSGGIVGIDCRVDGDRQI
jgi:hypothetical protein